MGITPRNSSNAIMTPSNTLHLKRKLNKGFSKTIAEKKMLDFVDNPFGNSPGNGFSKDFDDDKDNLVSWKEFQKAIETTTI